MQNLINAANKAVSEHENLPFSVYSSIKEQQIFNVPIIKPLLIFVLGGSKRLGEDDETVCSRGSFIFLSNSPTIDMRNIPDHEAYYALLIEFEYADFEQFRGHRSASKPFIKGKIDRALETTLRQFIEWSTFAPPETWHFRRQEILQLLYQSGHTEICSIAEAPGISQKVHDIISSDLNGDLGVDYLAGKLAMSESTLRRKLKAEGTSVQGIRDQVKLGYGLHLIQTTMQPIGLIAEHCGYQSQSKFTTRFKQLFGITPTALRKTRMQD